MKIQISRDSHNPLKRYSGVYQQQGRMLTDADWNALMDILKYRLFDVLRDVVGGGTPQQGGMEIVSGGVAPRLKPGRIYVDGLAAEVQGDDTVSGGSADFAFDQQGDFPFPPPLADAGTDYRLYADVWERSVVFLEDPDLRDAGLHGADTCTRTQTMVQIKWCPTARNPEDPSENPPRGNTLLTLELRQGSTGPDPCDPCADELALQERVGNYLFRVEIHDVETDASGQPRKITFKWSSENGAEQYAVGQEPPGFKSPNWVYEFFSGEGATERFASEKHLGVHLATGGWDPVRGRLAHGYPETPPAGFSLVRRWDGACVVERAADGTWDLAAGSEGSDRGVPLSAASGSDAPGHFIPGTAIGINLDAMVLTLDLQNRPAVAGDFWYAPVREAANQPGDTLLDAAAPIGIVHHYLTLAQVSGGTVTLFPGAECRRHEFPPLTDLHAEDICFNNSQCQMPIAHTVQEAIDRLCQERDLRHHNKHLHGWGIVCGLQLECGPEVAGNGSRREQVVVQDGYAIDCSGNDVILDQPALFNLLDRITQFDQDNPDRPLLDANGDGSACLSVRLDESGAPVFDIERYDSSQNDFQRILDGTLLMDFYNDCIKALVDAVKEELTPETPTQTKALVGPAQRRLTALLNLVIQLFNPTNGRYVFLSPAEHAILEKFYLRLIELLKSKTFCAMFQDARFPAYPFPDTGMATFFGKGFHTRLRLHPSGETLFSCGGADSKIHIYHTQKQELIDILDMPAGEGAEVRDVAFSPDGKQLYAIAWLKGTDTVFKVADFNGTTYEWRQPTTVFCDLKFTTLAGPPSGREEQLFAIGKGRGLYILNPEKILTEAKPRPEPKYAFNAVGHLVLGAGATQAYATASGGNDATDRYDRVAFMDVATLPDGDNAPPGKILTLQHPESNETLTGDDDIALGSTDPREAERLYVVTRPAKSGNQKHLLTFEKLAPAAILDVENTAIRLLFHPATKQLLLSMEDGYRIQVVDPTGAKTVTDRHPVQISPIALAGDEQSGQVYALNFLSNTVSSVPAKELNTDAAFLKSLEDYRTAVLSAFLRLLGGLVQYLKDCGCHKLLVDCPDCDEKDKLFLGVAEVREREIYKVCNFSKRKYVMKLPTLNYWLSIVPIIPLIKLGVEKLCCAVLPDLASQFIQTPQPGTVSHRIQSQPLRKGVRTYQQTDIKGEWRAQQKTLNVGGLLFKDAVTSRVESSSFQQPGIRKSLILGGEVNTTRKDLEAGGVTVEKVETYDPALGTRNLIELGKAPVRVAPGTKITLYEKDGKVMYYRLAEPVEVTGVSDTVKKEIETLEKRKTALGDMSDVNAELARADAKRTEIMNLAALRQELGTLSQEKSTMQQELAAAREEIAALKAERTVVADLGTLKTELDQLTAARQAEATGLADLEKRRTTVADDLTKLQGSLDTMSKMHKEISVEIARERPVREVSGITKEMDAHLRELGIRTVAELAVADPAVIAPRGAPITPTLARTLISRAKKRIAPR